MKTRLIALEDKYLSGIPLTESDARLAEIAVLSSAIDDRIVGVEALVRYEQSQGNTLATRTLIALTALCSDTSLLNDVLGNKLLIAMMPVPSATLIENAILRHFVLVAASIPGTKINSMILVGKLAKSGDEDARSIIMRALDDTNMDVRRNARYALNRLKGTST